MTDLSAAERSCRTGDEHYRLGHLPEALAHFQRAVEIAGSVAAYAYKLGNVFADLGRPQEALASYRRALELEPRHAQASNNLGTVLELLGRLEEALVCYRRAVDADPTLSAARNNLAVLLHRLGKAGGADQTLADASAGPSLSADDWLARGNATQAMGRQDEAVHCYDQALALAPDSTPARLHRLAIRLSLGFTLEAIAGYREILQAEPQHEGAASRLLLALAHEPASAADFFAEHQAFARRFAPPEAPTLDATTPRRHGGKIRIGYVSADFSTHPIGVVLAPIVQFHDRATFEIYLYSNVDRPDTVTEWFRTQATAWRSIAHLSDADAAGAIRADDMDILVFVASHFDDNRPLLARYRAAPVQASFWDTATSALEEMDYLIADRGLVPRTTAERFSEKVACIPTSYVRAPLSDAPPVAPPPAVSNGYVTFGSFNSPAKINDAVIALWAQILHRTPASRLLFQYAGVFANASARARIARRFERARIPADRLVFKAYLPGAALARYSLADIALDTFPFSGMTTTVEALWMGVPVVAMDGDRMVARYASTALRKAGLADLVARDASGYLAIVQRLASGPDALAALRQTLRDRVAHSPLCAERPRARQLERLYRWMLATKAHVLDPKAV